VKGSGSVPPLKTRMAADIGYMGEKDFKRHLPEVVMIGRREDQYGFKPPFDIPDFFLARERFTMI
jgi:hypothetical protein